MRARLTMVALSLCACAPTVGSPGHARPAPSSSAEPAAGDKADSGLFDGPGYSFRVRPPKGWVLDRDSGASLGLDAVFYTEGSRWGDGSVFMFVKTARRSDEQTLASFMAEDIKLARKRGGGSISVEARPALPTADGRQALVKSLTHRASGERQAMAYLAEPTVFVMLGLVANGVEAYDQSLLPFGQLVGSYAYLTDELPVEF